MAAIDPAAAQRAGVLARMVQRHPHRALAHLGRVADPIMVLSVND